MSDQLWDEGRGGLFSEEGCAAFKYGISCFQRWGECVEELCKCISKLGRVVFRGGISCLQRWDKLSSEVG